MSVYVLYKHLRDDRWEENQAKGREQRTAIFSLRPLRRPPFRKASNGNTQPNLFFHSPKQRHKGFNTLSLEFLNDKRITSRNTCGNLAVDSRTDIFKPVEAHLRHADQAMD